MQVMIVLLSMMVALGGGFMDSNTVSTLSGPVAIVAESTTATATTEPAEVLAEAVAEAEAEEIAAMEEDGYLGQVANEVVDVEAWREEFVEIWNAEHADPIDFTVAAPDEDDDFPTLLMADMGSAIYLQMYYSREAEIYWYVVSISEENTPVRKQEQYEEYFYSAIMTGLMAHYDELTVREHKDIDAMVRDYVQSLQAGTITEDDAWFYYLNTYICFEYDDELGLFECYIGF